MIPSISPLSVCMSSRRTVDKSLSISSSNSLWSSLILSSSRRDQRSSVWGARSPLVSPLLGCSRTTMQLQKKLSFLLCSFWGLLSVWEGWRSFWCWISRLPLGTNVGDGGDSSLTGSLKVTTRLVTAVGPVAFMYLRESAEVRRSGPSWTGHESHRCL